MWVGSHCICEGDVLAFFDLRGWGLFMCYWQSWKDTLTVQLIVLKLIFHRPCNADVKCNKMKSCLFFFLISFLTRVESRTWPPKQQAFQTQSQSRGRKKITFISSKAGLQFQLPLWQTLRVSHVSLRCLLCYFRMDIVYTHSGYWSLKQRRNETEYSDLSKKIWLE